VGKLTASHRFDRLPLLPSGPGGVQQELVVQDLPGDKSRNFFCYDKHFWRNFFCFSATTADLPRYQTLIGALFFNYSPTLAVFIQIALLVTYANIKFRIFDSQHS